MQHFLQRNINFSLVLFECKHSWLGSGRGSIWRPHHITLHYLMMSISLPVDKMLPGHQLNYVALQWRHNECDGVSNHRPDDYLLKRVFRHKWKKHQSSASLAFVKGIQRWPVNSPHKGKMFPFDDVIMKKYLSCWISQLTTPTPSQVDVEKFILGGKSLNLCVVLIDGEESSWENGDSFIYPYSNLMHIWYSCVLKMLCLIWTERYMKFLDPHGILGPFIMLIFLSLFSFQCEWCIIPKQCWISFPGVHVIQT